MFIAHTQSVVHTQCPCVGHTQCPCVGHTQRVRGGRAAGGGRFAYNSNPTPVPHQSHTPTPKITIPQLRGENGYQCNLPLGAPPQPKSNFSFLIFGVREVFHWIRDEILCILVVSKPEFEDSVSNLGFWCQISTKAIPCLPGPATTCLPAPATTCLPGPATTPAVAAPKAPPEPVLLLDKAGM